MPKYQIGIYEERFGTIIVQAANEELAGEKVEEALTSCGAITELELFEERSYDKGVAIDVSDPEDIGLAITEIINDS